MQDDKFVNQNGPVSLPGGNPCRSYCKEAGTPCSTCGGYKVNIQILEHVVFAFVLRLHSRRMCLAHRCSSQPWHPAMHICSCAAPLCLTSHGALVKLGSFTAVCSSACMPMGDMAHLATGF